MTTVTKGRLALQILWRVALFFLAFALVGAVLIVPLGTLFSDWSSEHATSAQLYADIVGACAILLATWIMTRFVDRRPLYTIGLSRHHALRDLAVGLGVGAVWLAASVGSAWAAGWAHPTIAAGFSVWKLLVAVISLTFNVLTQQLLLCGYIFQTLRSRSGVGVALVLSAGLFVAYHAGAFEGSWLPAVNVFAAATVFCLAYVLTGNLWLPAGIHVAWNVLLGPVLGLTVSGNGELGLGWSVFAIEGPPLFTGGSFGLEGGLLVTLSTAALIAVFLHLGHRRRTWTSA